MTEDEEKDKAIAITKDNNPGKTTFEINRVYENFMDGTLISVAFPKDPTIPMDTPGNKDSNHIYFDRDGTVRVIHVGQMAPDFIDQQALSLL